MNSRIAATLAAPHDIRPPAAGMTPTRAVARAARGVALLAALTLAIGACGSDGESAADERPEPAEAPDETPVPREEPVETAPVDDSEEESSTTTSAVPSPPTTSPDDVAAATDDTVPTAAALGAVGEPSPRYDDVSLWLCRGEFRGNVCTDDLDVTVVAPDGSTTVVERSAADDPAADCFYVYPTVDLSPGPGNASLAEPLDDALRAGIELVVSQQAAPFSTTCRVFAPYYEQATFGSYGLRNPAPPDLTSAPFEVAYAQVLDAFRWYMANENDGRPIVLIGHSQGSQHLARLAAELFDPSPELTERLAVAILPGPGGYGLSVAANGTTGGTFERLPLCTALGEAGCVIAYNSYLDDTPPTNWFAAGTDDAPAACVSPSELVDGSSTASEAIFDYPLMGPDGIATDLSTIGLGEIPTRFVGYPAAYTAACTTDGTRTWLEIAPADPADARPSIPLETPQVTSLDLGLHLLDMQLMSGDLLTLTAAAIDAALAE